MSVLEILGLVWTGSIAIIAIDGFIIVSRAEEYRRERLIHRVLMSVCKTVWIAPIPALLVLISWLFAAMDYFERWMLNHNATVMEWLCKKDQRHDDEDL